MIDLKNVSPSARLKDPFSCPSLSGTGPNITKQKLVISTNLSHIYSRNHVFYWFNPGAHVIILFVLLLLRHGVHVSFIMTHVIQGSRNIGLLKHLTHTRKENVSLDVSYQTYPKISRQLFKPGFIIGDYSVLHP